MMSSCPCSDNIVVASTKSMWSFGHGPFYGSGSIFVSCRWFFMTSFGRVGADVSCLGLFASSPSDEA